MSTIIIAGMFLLCGFKTGMQMQFDFVSTGLCYRLTNF